jgi:lipopolysaccharide biosynthesis glycosyltransferase
MKNVYKINPEKINAVVLHFMSKTKPWYPDSPFNQEWKDNLDKAGLVNLKKPRNPRDIISEQEIQEYEEHLKKGGKIYFFNRILWNLAKTRDSYTEILAKITDRYMGIMGIFLKTHLPNLYFKLKN